MNRIKLLIDGEPVHRKVADDGRALAMQAADALHEELVEVARKDREEPHALEQRQRGILRKLEHTLVEVEPAQLAVQEELIRTGRRRRCGRLSLWRTGKHRRFQRDCTGGSESRVSLNQRLIRVHEKARRQPTVQRRLRKEYPV